MKNDDDILPTYAPSFGRLAGLLCVSRSHLRDVQQGDPRFPKKTARGWPVIKVGSLLRARDYERMSDAEFNREHHVSALETLRQIKDGELPELKQFTKLFEDMASGRTDIFPDGRTARQEAIADALDAVARIVTETKDA